MAHAPSAKTSAFSFRLAASALSAAIGSGSWYLYQQKQTSTRDEYNFNHNSQTQLSQLSLLHWLITPAHAASVPAPASPKPAATPAKTATLTPAADIMKFGYPGLENVQFYDGFILSYDRRLRNARWVCQHLNAAKIKQHRSQKKHTSNAVVEVSQGTAGAPVVSRVNSQFVEDEKTPQLFRAKNSDFTGSGYDRGHLVPAKDMEYVGLSQKAMDETFTLSNISPQVGVGFNRSYWARFELFVRLLTHHFDDVYVITGPLYLPKYDPQTGKWVVKYEVIGTPPTIAVPTHFFKVILGVKNDPTVTVGNNKNTVGTRTQYGLAAFVMPNDNIDPNAPLEAFLVPLEEVERQSGLQFFDKIIPHYAIQPPAGTPVPYVPLCSLTSCKMPAFRFPFKNEGNNKQQQPQMAADETIELE